MDASHTIWFRSLLEQFAAAVAAGDFAGKEAETSLRCIELITTAYASAEQGSRELPLGRERRRPRELPRSPRAMRRPRVDPSPPHSYSNGGAHP